MGVSQITVNGRNIIYVECSNISIQRKDELKNILDKGNVEIAKCGEKNAFVITNVTNSTFNSEIAESFKNYAKKNTPYVKASAIVGLSGLQNIIFNAIKVLTKRDYYVAKSLDDAKEYISRQ